MFLAVSMGHNFAYDKSADKTLKFISLVLLHDCVLISAMVIYVFLYKYIFKSAFYMRMATCLKLRRDCFSRNLSHDTVQLVSAVIYY